MTLVDKIRKIKDAGIFFGAVELSPLSKSSGNPFLISYGKDFLLPLAVYSLCNLIVSGEDRCYKGLAAFLTCSAGEIAQKMGWYPGAYDPKDFIAYAAGATTAVGLDYLISKLKKEKGK